MYKHFTFYLLVSVLTATCSNDPRRKNDPSSNQNQVPGSQGGSTSETEQNETARKHATGLGLTTPSTIGYMGECIESAGDSFTRNEGLETCTVISATNTIFETSQGQQAGCVQSLACSPTDPIIVDPTGAPVDNPLGDAPYQSGGVHRCQDDFTAEVQACQGAATQELFDSCYYLANFRLNLCIEIAMLVNPEEHFDCDDYSYHYQMQCQADGITCVGLGCQTEGGGHALNIIEQPDGNDTDNSCRMCIVEPQSGGTGEESPMVTCWNQPCGTPVVPEHIQMQQGISNCSTFVGVDPNAGEPLCPIPSTTTITQPPPSTSMPSSSSSTTSPTTSTTIPSSTSTYSSPTTSTTMPSSTSSSYSSYATPTTMPSSTSTYSSYATPTTMPSTTSTWE